MATLKPFRALRPDPAKAQQICTPPYDVMSADEARVMAEGNPLSFLRVTRPEIEMPEGADAHSDEAYELAARNLKELIANGALLREEKPCYYLYRLVMGSHEQLGLVAVASCTEYDRGIVKKHELTRPDKEDDRTRHIEITGAQTGPVFLTFRSTPETDLLLAEAAADNPVVDFTANDGIRHTAWVISDPAEVKKIESAFQRVPALYIADGHHRSAAAARVFRQRAKTATQEESGGSRDLVAKDAVAYFLTVTFPHNQMQILGYNRVVKNLNGLTPEVFMKKLEGVAEVEEGTPDDSLLPTEKGEMTMYFAGKWYTVRWSEDAAKAATEADRLDVAVLQRHVLTPLLGIDDPRTSDRIAFIGGIRGPRELVKLVDGGQYAVAFAMFPTSVEDLMAIADEGGIMPPKSTWFEPKLRDAMMVHTI
ncbi:MAG: DUF1015 family protein [Sumerlaeia bacterium]